MADPGKMEEEAMQCLRSLASCPGIKSWYTIVAKKLRIRISQIEPAMNAPGGPEQATPY